MIGDITTRLRQTRADMIGTPDEAHYWDCHDAAVEIERLREAIRRLADQDATLSVVGGNVIVQMDGE
jgi:phosphoribosylaminoimidazole-succinocarboxamide synthase